MQRDGDFTNEGFWQPTAVVVNTAFARDVGAFVGALWEHCGSIASTSRLNGYAEPKKLRMLRGLLQAWLGN